MISGQRPPSPRPGGRWGLEHADHILRGKSTRNVRTYFRDRRSPTPKETKGVGFLAKAAAAVLAQV